jgi:hypothetical protein
MAAKQNPILTRPMPPLHGDKSHLIRGTFYLLSKPSSGHVARTSALLAMQDAKQLARVQRSITQNWPNVDILQNCR